MKKIRLNARVRQDSGKKNSHKIRNNGEIPCVLYGHKEEPVILALPEHDFWIILHHATTEHLIIHLGIDGDKGEDVLTLVKEVQHHPVTGAILHVDLQRISEGETIKVGVPVNLIGTPAGVKDFGGILDHGAREVMISTTPALIPELLEIDVSGLMIGDSLKLADLVEKYPEIEFIDDEMTMVASVSAPKKLEALEAEGEEEAAEEGAEAVEGEEGEEEGEEEKEGS